MKGIETKYHGATDYQPSRISAQAVDNPRRYYSYDHGASDPHREAAQQYAQEMGWHGKWVGGSVHSNPKGCVYVNVDGFNSFTVDE